MKKRLACSLLTLVFLLCAAAWGAAPARAIGAVDYMEASWDETGETVVYTEKRQGGFTPVTSGTTAWTGGWYVVSSSVEITDRIVCTGDVRLILCDGRTLTASQGVTVAYADANGDGVSDNSLTVYAQRGGTGVLAATGGNGDAAIGGGEGPEGGTGGTGGTVTIHGGTVTATSCDLGAGIGGGGARGPFAKGGAGGTVTVYGGTVTATGSAAGGAGIGGGGAPFEGGAGGAVTVWGGTVTATGIGGCGAGIGGSEGGAGGKVVIHGGTVTATGAAGGAGIGGGGGAAGGEVTVTGGIVTATANGAAGSGIGGGGGGGAGGAVSITGGVVRATGNRYEDCSGAGIGGWSCNGDRRDGTLSVGDGCKVWGRDSDSGSWSLITDLSSRSLDMFVEPEVSYVSAGGDEPTVSAIPGPYTIVTGSAAEWSAGWYVVNGDVAVEDRITLTGDVSLVLCDGCTLTAKKGVEITDRSLSIYAQSGGTGALSATGGSAAAIGDGTPLDSCNGKLTLGAGVVLCNENHAPFLPAFYPIDDDIFRSLVLQTPGVKTQQGGYYAADELADALDDASGHNADDAGTVTLLRDVTTSEMLMIAPDAFVTLDLNGHTLDRGLAGESGRSGGSVIEVEGTLTLEDNSQDKTGRLTGGNVDGYGGGVYVYDGAFTMTGGTISGNSANEGGGVYVYGRGTFTMTGGTISGNSAASAGGGVYVLSGTFAVSGTPVVRDNFVGGTLQNGAYVQGESGVPDNVNGFIRVTGALMQGAHVGVTLEVGGAFAKGDYDAESNPGGYTLTADDVARFTSDDPAYEVILNDDGEAALATPWGVLNNRLGAGGTVTLDKDYTAGASDGALTVPEGVEVTLDLNGHTLDRGLAGKSAGSGGSVIAVAGTLTLTDGSEDKTGRLTGGNTDGNGGGVYVSGGSTFTMTGGTISGNAADEGGGVYANGTFAMTGGTISGNSAASAGGGVCVCGVFAVSGAPVVRDNFKGGALQNGVYVQGAVGVPDNAHRLAGQMGEILVAGGLTQDASVGVTKENGGLFARGSYDEKEEPDGHVLTAADAARFTSDDTDYAPALSEGNEASLWTPSWAALQAKLCAGGTVTLDKNYTAGGPDGALFVPAGVTVTLDLNGFTITGRVTVNAGGESTVSVEGMLTLTDGSEDKTGAITGYNGVYVEEAGTFTMTGGAVRGCTNSGVYVCEAGTFNMKGGTISGNGPTGGGDSDECGGGVLVVGTFNMEGGTISGNVAVRGGGVCLKNAAEPRDSDEDDDAPAVFRMSGGAITGNNALEAGGGVWNDSFASCAIEISGDARIVDNFAGGAQENGVYVQGTDGVPSNIVLPLYDIDIDEDYGLHFRDFVTVAGALTGQAAFGVQIREYDVAAEGYVPAAGVFARGSRDAENADGYALTAADAARFTSDFAAYGSVLAEDGAGNEIRLTADGLGKFFVGGTDVVAAGGTVAGKTVDGGSGTAELVFDAEGKPVLTLTNYENDGCGDKYAAICYEAGGFNGAPLTVVLVGENTLTGPDGVPYDDDNAFSVGIDSDYGLLFTGTGTLTAMGGPSKVGERINQSFGVYSAVGLTVDAGVTLIAYGGEADGAESISSGVFCYESSLFLKDGATLYAEGGTAWVSAGVYCEGMWNNDDEHEEYASGGDLTVGAGAGLTAKGGTGTGDGGRSGGIYCDHDVTIKAGTAEKKTAVEAIGGTAPGESAESAGILCYAGTLRIEENAALHAKGDDAAIAVPVVTAVAGAAHGSDGAWTQIDISAEAQPRENFYVFDEAWFPGVAVTFSANFGDEPETKTQILPPVAAALPANGFTRAGYAFKEWNTKADGTGTAYADKVEVTPEQGMTLYAMWKPAASLEDGKVTARAGARLVLAQYGGGRMTEMKSVTLTADCTQESAAALLGLDALPESGCKLMLVGGATFAPLCEAWSAPAP